MCLHSPTEWGSGKKASFTVKFSQGLDVSKFSPHEVLAVFHSYCYLDANRLPSQILGGDTPYKLLNGEDPDLQMLRPFGCLAYAVNLVAHRSKFDNRSLKCIFLGYEACHKGFLLYDLDNGKVIVSRDVKFNTDCFPYADRSSLHSPTIDTHSLPFPSFPDFDHVLPNEEDHISSSSSPVLLDSHVSTSSPIPITATADSLVTCGSLSSSTYEACSQSIPTEPIAVRKRVRERKPPVWMADYVGHVSFDVSFPNAGVTPHTFPFVVSPGLTPSYTTFLFNMHMIKEPSSYRGACYLLNGLQQ